MSVSKEQLLELLKHVNHPSSGSDIVTAGLVKDISFSENIVTINLVFPKQNDPFSNSIKKACAKTIESALGNGVEIKFNEQFASRKLSAEFS